jgi:hypothetical protein
MTGLIWFVQIVHYPLFKAVGNEAIQSYAVQHASRTSFVVIIPMLLELASATYLFFYRPEWISWGESVASLTLVILIFASTFFLQVPLHNLIQSSGSQTYITSLVMTNWVRTICWTVRAGLLSYVMLRVLTFVAKN